MAAERVETAPARVESIPAAVNSPRGAAETAPAAFETAPASDDSASERDQIDSNRIKQPPAHALPTNPRPHPTADRHKSALTFRENPASPFEFRGTQGSEDFDGASGVWEGFTLPALPSEGLGKAAAVGSY